MGKPGETERENVANSIVSSIRLFPASFPPPPPPPPTPPPISFTLLAQLYYLLLIAMSFFLVGFYFVYLMNILQYIITYLLSVNALCACNVSAYVSNNSKDAIGRSTINRAPSSSKKKKKENEKEKE